MTTHVDTGKMDLDEITSFILGLLISKDTPMEKRRKVRESLIAVYASGKGYPVMTTEQAIKELGNVTLNNKKIYGSGITAGTPGTVFLRGGFSKEKVRALLHWMDNPDLYN